jgi:D-glycero-D-manno-heptose 1,7-bisphosphate phosphatase
MGVDGVIRAVLFDRDGTLVRDVPYNGDPDLVEPMPGAAHCVQRMRDLGLKVGVVTNQSAVGRGMLDFEDVERVNLRIERYLGAFDTWQICPHAPWEGCACRKPAPALIESAARALRVVPGECLVVGNEPTDVLAAERAGARGLLFTQLSEVESLVEGDRSDPVAIRF